MRKYLREYTEDFMKKSLLKSALLVVMIALLTASLAACGLFNSQKTISKVDIDVISGLENESGVYVAHIGEEFVLSANWHNARVTKADVEWHEIANGEDNALDEKSKTFSHAYSREDLDKTFQYYVVVNGNVKSDKIFVRVEVAPLSAPVLSANLEITGNVIQQNLIDGATDVELSVSWNENALEDGTSVAIAWYVEGKKQDDTSKIFVYSVSEISDECMVKIKVELTDGTQTTHAEISLVFVKRYALADSLSVVPTSDMTEVCEDTYFFKATPQGDKTKTFSTTLLPLGANQSASCEWTLTDSTGKTSVVEKTARVANVALSYGKNTLKATVQNVESRQIIVYALEYDFENIPTGVKDAMQNKFLWLGNYYDSYILSQTDLNAYVGYAISKHVKGEKFEMYVANANWQNVDKFSERVSQAVDEGGDESGSFSYSVALSGTSGSVSFTDKTVFGIPKGAYAPKTDSEQIKGYLRYSAQSEKRTSLPIDNAQDSVKVSNSNELYRAVSFGYKPIFATDTEGKALEKLYAEARNVLETYLSDDMSDYQKVAAIYDWIVNVVDYDYAVAELGGTDTSKYNAFYLEGVFNDHRAVCDGKSKAFALLCGMEGIRAVRVIGYANKDLKNMSEAQQKACGHAWNKVLVDANGDGEREWYVVDTTWGDLAVGKDGTDTVYEYLNYAYFLKTDADIADTHMAKTASPTADTTFDVYKNTYITVGIVKIDLYIETKAELDAVLEYSRDNGYMAICVYIAPSVQGTSYNRIPLGDNQFVIYAAKGLIF